MKVSKKLGMALRQHEGKRRLSEYIDTTSQSLGRSEETIRLLDLEETDELRSLFDTKLSSCSSFSTACFRRAWPAHDIGGLRRIISKLKQQAAHHPMVLFRNLSQYCGAVETSSNEILDRALHLVSLDQESLMAASADASFGLFLSFDTDKYETSNIETFELLVWGDEWLSVLADEQVA